MSHPFDESYFKSFTYKKTSFARFSQYWWSNRFYAMLARRNGKHGARLLEIGSGLGHLAGQLEGDFKTCSIDINFWALHQSRGVASDTPHVLASAQEIPFADGIFNLLVTKHVVEHLPHPERAIEEMGRITASGGVLILSTPNLDSLLKPWKGKNWIGYQDPTHISLKPPAEWLAIINEAGFRVRRVFADGFWDVPYIKVLPSQIQKFIFGAPGGFQAITGLVFLPMRWGESIIVIAEKQ